MFDEKKIKEWFARELRERMEDAGLQPYHMPHLCHAKINSVYNYLGGASFPSPWSLVLMAEHLDCCVNDLLGYEEPRDAAVFERYLASRMYANAEEYAHCLADRITRFMNDGGITVDDLSDKTGFNERTIKQWFGVRPKLPKTAYLLRLCEALDCTPTDLLGY